MNANHGTRSLYVRGCRCTSCKSASRAYHRGRRLLAMRRRGVDHQLRDVALVAAGLHGRLSTYTNHCCRCEDCTAALREYARKQRVPASLSVLPEETP